LVSYCDDLWILGNYSNINQLKEVAIQCITEYGLAVNIDKCKQYDRASNGIVLGTAIGTTEFINNHIENVIETVETMIELINEDKLHPKNRLMFIKYCIKIPSQYSLLEITCYLHTNPVALIKQLIKVLVGF
jgi:hypothetical protein